MLKSTPISQTNKASMTMRSLPQLKAAFRLCGNLSLPASLDISSLPTLTPLIRHASSSGDAPTETNSPTLNKNQVSADPDYVSIKEMKGLIEQYDQGDMDAIPSIFEAILKRKLVHKKNNLQYDPDLDQLLDARRLGHGSDENPHDDDDDTEEEETDVDSDWTSDENK